MFYMEMVLSNFDPGTILPILTISVISVIGIIGINAYTDYLNNTSKEIECIKK